MSLDVSQFLAVFYEESFEGLEAMEAGLLEMQPGASVDADTINSVFRAAHSIKGGAGTFGLMRVCEFTHVVETLLDQMRSGQREPTAAAHRALFESVDCLREMLCAQRDGLDVDEIRVKELQASLEALLDASTSSGHVEEREPPQPPVRGWSLYFRPAAHLLDTGNDPLRILRELEGLGSLHVDVDTEALPPFHSLEPHSLYLAWRMNLAADVPREVLDEVFEWVVDDCELTIEPVVGVPPAVATEASVSESAVTSTATVPNDKACGGTARTAKSTEGGSIRVSIEKIDSLINVVGELVITQSMLSQFGQDLSLDRLEHLQDGLAQLERNTRELQEGVLGIRMLPISFAFNRLPRIVHDIGTKLEKQVELSLSGGETEVDKTVMEKIGDPLVHLVRNAVDHGIETPAARLAAGKPETGSVHIHAYHRGGNIVIEIADDGGGIDQAKLLSKALDAGIINENDGSSAAEILDLVFHPGLSTADQVSDISGRGVGMDVVRNNIRELGGTVDATSVVGSGTTFTIRLPLTLAILDGQTIAVGKETYIVPLVSIIESIQVREPMLNLVAGKGETFKLRDEYLPIVRLHEVFGITGAQAKNLTEGILVVVEGDGRRCGLFVDELRGHQQVVIKSLEANYKRVEGVSGATILGDGSVALILDLPGLIRLAHTRSHQETHLRKSA